MTSKKACQEIACVVIWHGGRVLIGQRPAGVPLAGYWEFPGGKVEPGETPEAAAARECQEETGLAVSLGEPYPAAEFEYPHGKLRLHFFRADWPGGTNQLSGRYIWVFPGELPHYKFPPANQALISKLLHEC
jgi:mutator protein MutT